MLRKLPQDLNELEHILQEF